MVPLRLPEHLAQAFHDLVRGGMFIPQTTRETLPGLADTFGLVDRQLFRDRQMHGQVKKGIAAPIGGVKLPVKRLLRMVEKGVIFGVHANPVGGDGLERRERLTCNALSLRFAEEPAYIMLRWIKHWALPGLAGGGRFGLAAEFAVFANQAAPAFGFAGFADIAPMQDQPVVGILAELLGH